MVAMILLRALHKDISRYNAVDAQEDVQEDYGWKLVHGDVFRPPTRSMLLAVFVGSGTQLIAMTALTLGKIRLFIRLHSIDCLQRATISLCCPWLPLAIQPWFAGYCDGYFLHGLWMHCRLRVCSYL